MSEPLSERQKKRRCPAQAEHEASAVRAERGPRALFGGAGLAEQPVDALGRIIGADIGLAGLDDAPVFGIVAALLLEPDSQDTLANAVNTARLLKARGKGRIVLVTDRLHLPRAALLFCRAELDIVGVAGVPARSVRKALAAACYEIASLIRAMRRL